MKNNDYFRDPSMIPYTMTKEYGYEGHLVTVRQEEDYSNYSKYVPELQLDFIESEEMIHEYLKENSKNIDVLNVFFLEIRRGLKWIKWYKKYNPRGIAYLKLDANLYHATDLLENRSFKYIAKRIILAQMLKKVDFVSSETTPVKRILEKALKREVLYIPDGFSNMAEVNESSIPKKKQILTVGKLGTYEKNTGLLIDAYVKSSINKKYDLILVGSRTREIDEYIMHCFEKEPSLKDKIILKGEIKDRDELGNVYEESEVFVFPSIIESFGLAMVEAAAHGCYIISTNGVPAFKDVVPDDKSGSMFDSGKVSELIDIFDNIESNLESFDGEVIRKNVQKFEWKNICKALDENLREVFVE